MKLNPQVTIFGLTLIAAATSAFAGGISSGTPPGFLNHAVCSTVDAENKNGIYQVFVGLEDASSNQYKITIIDVTDSKSSVQVDSVEATQAAIATPSDLEMFHAQNFNLEINESEYLSSGEGISASVTFDLNGKSMTRSLGCQVFTQN